MPGHFQSFLRNSDALERVVRTHFFHSQVSTFLRFCPGLLCSEMDKDRVAEILVSIGTLLELKGENPFKTRAYSNAARTIETLSEPLEKLIAEDRLGEIKGIGEALQKKITELVTTGKLPYYEELKASVPPGLRAMLDIPGVGPKKIMALRQELGVESVEQLEQACKDGRVAKLKGFGEKTATNICEGIQRRRTFAEKHLLDD